ncbi:hypothetical protein EDB81DRAFT_374951 [Dactylonectria macrodidyma]|uniref:Uncharacterized protein n=1 Tax=Dactylonectria macrodidyma TaxID=307937 RepID=A0A9P9I7S6_9HYPO|nr:hypothetical protein EDB81DRAFT_374951 [Dactylonectria macrodidyma]
MEPLDTDLRGFVRVWNNHYIRKHPNRPHVVPGVPYILFHHPEQSSTEDCGEPIIPAVLEEMEELLGYTVDHSIYRRISLPRCWRSASPYSAVRSGMGANSPV